MKRAALALWLVPLVLAVTFWFLPPDGDDSYHHTMNAIEQARAWHEGAVLPRYHRGWNGGTGTFAPTIYSPISQSVQGGLAMLVGDGQRAVGISLAAGLLAAAIALAGWSRQPIAVLTILTPYFLAVSLTRSTTTEAWALAGAAIVLPLAMPPALLSRWRGLGLAIGIVLVSGCQVGMLLQLGWLLAAAWTTSLVLAWRGVSEQTLVSTARSLATVVGWGSAGLCAGAYLWLPAVVDARYLAIGELVSGPLDWRHNFLPSSSELGLLLSATALGLVVVGGLLIAGEKGADRFALAAALLAGVILCTPLSAVPWHFPKMENLQFPWRFLGPTTLIAVMALPSLRGRRRDAAIVALLLPLVLLPIRLSVPGRSVPTASTPEELAQIGQRQWNLVPVLPTTAGFYSLGYHRLESLDQLARQHPALEVLERSAADGSWRVTSDAAGSVLLPLQWWPEWRIQAGGRDLSYTNRSGLVAVSLAAGAVEVHASLKASTSRTAGAVLSSLGLAVLLLLTALWGRGRGHAAVLPGAE